MLSSQASCVIVSRFRAALDLDTYPLSNFIRPQRAKPSRGKPVLIMHIGFFACFSRHISRTQLFQRYHHIIFLALVALKLISRLIACSTRIVTDKQTNKQTDTQNDYCNPRCACAAKNYFMAAVAAKKLSLFYPHPKYILTIHHTDT